MQKYTTQLRFVIFAMVLLFHFQGFTQNRKAVEQLEQTIHRVVKRAFGSSVKISAYDTISKKQEEAMFSGVAVTAEGHILTVAHAARPNQVYQVTFPDGAQHIAVGLGRIAVKTGGRDFDLAMIKILKKGNWPFAEMGWNTGMKVNALAVSIAYPGSFDRALPNVRIGRITDVAFAGGYFESSCKMEPGDSGGPLFDADAKVIGLHSWIESDEERNFEVPVELFRKYWSALNVAIDYREFPKADDIHYTGVSENAAIPAIQTMALLSPKHAKSVVTIYSKRAGKEQVILGTLVAYQTAKEKQTFIISKNSMLAEHITVDIAGEKIAARVVGRDKDNDLALLKTDRPIRGGIDMDSQQNPAGAAREQPGSFLISGLGKDGQRIGVLSSTYTDMPMRFSVGFFGANANFINRNITITEIMKGSAADQLLQLNDQVRAINGVQISRPAEYGAELMKHLAGDSITIDVVREEKPMHLKMFLPPYPGDHHVAYLFAGGRSARSDGFKKVLVQDAAILATECGGSVFDISGRFCGINIARHSRTSTIIMPAEVIIDFMKKLLAV